MSSSISRRHRRACGRGRLRPIVMLGFASPIPATTTSPGSRTEHRHSAVHHSCAHPHPRLAHDRGEIQYSRFHRDLLTAKERPNKPTRPVSTSHPEDENAGAADPRRRTQCRRRHSTPTRRFRPGERAADRHRPARRGVLGRSRLGHAPRWPPARSAPTGSSPWSGLPQSRRRRAHRGPRRGPAHRVPVVEIATGGVHDPGGTHAHLDAKAPAADSDTAPVPLQRHAVHRRLPHPERRGQREHPIRRASRSESRASTHSVCAGRPLRGDFEECRLPRSGNARLVGRFLARWNSRRVRASVGWRTCSGWGVVVSPVAPVGTAAGRRQRRPREVGRRSRCCRAPRRGMLGLESVQPPLRSGSTGP